jgi:hypothetical protein
MRTSRRGRCEHHGVDDANVVPYNRYLTLRFDAHINVELVYTVNYTKYMRRFMINMRPCASSASCENTAPRWGAT